MAIIEVVLGDITLDDSDAIVNAANSSLLGGGGVDGAIHASGGPAILEECRELRATVLPDGLPTGHAVATTAGRMPAGMVIHTVGPKHWEHPDGGAELLAQCHTACLEAAVAAGARTIAFPAISCGVYGWSPTEAAPVAVAAVRDWLSATPMPGTLSGPLGTDHPDSGPGIERIRFVVFNDDALRAFTSALAAD